MTQIQEEVQKERGRIAARLEDRAKDFERCALDLSNRGYGEPATAVYLVIARELRGLAEDIQKGPLDR